MAAAYPSFSTQQEEILYIHNETRRLEELIGYFHEQRAALLRRLNVIQSSTTRLPAETLSFILQHALPATDFSSQHNFTRDVQLHDDTESIDFSEDKPFQLVLGAVSSHWRQVIHSTPRIWDSLSLQIQPHSVRKSAALLKLFLVNSKTIPFMLSLRFPEIMGPNTPFLVHRSVDDLVIANLPRMKELHLVHPPRRWHSYTHLLTQLTECSLDLERHETYNPDKTVKLPQEAPLRRFSLQGALWRFDADFQLPWSSITYLTLSSIPPDLSVQAFIQCPNLIEFRCFSYSAFLPPLKPVDMTDPLTFSRLEIFEWETNDTPWSRALIRCLHLPALRRMRWNAFWFEDSSDIHTQAFLGRLPQTLTELELFPPSHFGFIRDDMNIDHVSLQQPSAVDFLAVLRKLKPKRNGQKLDIPLPRLRKLTVGEANEDLNHLDGTYAIAVMEMLEGRLDISNPSFCLDMPCVLIEWEPSVRGRLAQLLSAGFDIQIIDADS
ncbi:hypothetical protein NP233_g2907 [Leucocoprinus birnbaumii]|uniref:F-box domain-containing protein n=1 Tax=Leucocoprinus birnbaumii TaxID=56174 RepID=A0AAD5VY16_9AGAR|nr:hypothetical protein NP233_g2907 [Leucocoprinus birnbaumii]